MRKKKGMAMIIMTRTMRRTSHIISFTGITGAGFGVGVMGVRNAQGTENIILDGRELRGVLLMTE